MLITKFVAPADEMADIGLQAISMDRLGKFIALTGKNGAGKSRILTKLNHYILQRNQYFPQIDGIHEGLVANKNAIATQPKSPHQTGWRNTVVQLELQVGRSRYAEESPDAAARIILHVRLLIPRG